ncbi:nucleotidyltransferase domain-containing protein [Dictyoglomus thermophilum]|uniref:type VII toxin-antitoxin system MntA family adenylyltransferase antitoxin n=1 Tax=Dictyoglomus thermophilum TaxID=14 RepID=UPI0011EB9E9A|nr:nucleotidyltransferase domain-containing protein [Dictyoglomus thermophilum]TYT20334.1 nucleotidyltransferase domain-containing protein [Dictyoglomus thermophilum]
MKDKIIEAIKNELEKRENVLFAYIFGSFVNSEEYNDIDVAIYVSNFDREKVLDMEFELERILEDKVKKPFDVRIINEAPLGFVYNVLRNKIIVLDRDSLLRSDFESLIFRKYFDYQHLIEEYLKEIKNAPI